MGEPEAYDFSSCGVCGRTILRGERSAAYVSADGEQEVVCPLCKGAAEAAGWLPLALAGLRDEPEERGSRIGLRGRLARAGQRTGARLSHARAAAAARAAAREVEPEPSGEPVEAEPPGLDHALRLALEFFNATDEPRKVAGLRRSLGEPQVSVRPAPQPLLAEIAVAWELTWYRYEVAPSGEVKQVDRGDELDELPAQLRGWNATVIDGGRLTMRAA